VTRKKKPVLGRSPLPKQTGGAHKSPFDYDRRKWKNVGEEELPGDETNRSDKTGRSDEAERSGADD
jgi:hypothetical protein